VSAEVELRMLEGSEFQTDINLSPDDCSSEDLLLTLKRCQQRLAQQEIPENSTGETQHHAPEPAG